MRGVSAALARERPRPLVLLTWAAFLLVGWTSVLVPSLVPPIQQGFEVDDAAVGVYYFVWSAAYAAASFGGGFLTERVGRRLVLPFAMALMGVGMIGHGLAPSWLMFVLAAIAGGAGAGSIDGGVNGLALAIHEEGRGRALNLLHLFFAAGALSAPIVVGQLVSLGIPWQSFFVVTGIGGIALAAVLRAAPMPSGIHRPGAPMDPPASTRTQRPSAVLPLLLLAIGIGCYVASEVGFSNWVVRFLDQVHRSPVGVATLGLAAFWAGLALGRLLSARYAYRWSHSTLAIGASIAAGIGTIAAVAAPTPELVILASAVTGFASGPIFPVIVALGGDLYPDRLSRTTGILTGAAVVGGTLYPPLVGLMSARFGIGFGLLGAAVLSFLCAVAIVGAARRRLAAAAP
jgi:fucose permease